LQLGEPGEELAQLASAHRAFFCDAVAALREDLKFAVPRQEFDLNPGAHLRPRLFGERGFQLG
jgi:hypothetical protein